MSKNFIEKMLLSSDAQVEKIPVLPALIILIKLFDGEKTIQEFTDFMSSYGITITEDDKLLLQQYIDSIQIKLLEDATQINSFANNQEMSLKIARAIWFTKITPAILGLEFNLEDFNSINNKFLN